jgi:hypothetical protein
MWRQHMAMIWSIIRLIAARQMLKLSRWLLEAGEKIVYDEWRRRGMRSPDP